MAGLTGWHLILILAIVLLLFGAPKLPALARSLGQSMKIFKAEIKTPEDEKARADAAAGTVPGSTGFPGASAPGASAPDSSAATSRSDSANPADPNTKL
jgi:sec-independent protein translocase protein TatA